MAEKPFGRKVSRLMHFFERASSSSSFDGISPASSDYCHDIFSIKQSTLILDHNAKTLEKLKDEIVRRTKNDKNGLIGLYQGKYNGCLSRMRQELKNLVGNLYNNNEVFVTTTQPVEHVIKLSSKEDQDQVCTTPETTISDERWREEVRRLQAIVQRLTRECSAETRAKQEALSRCCALAESKLKEENPTLTDLSDDLRPSKITEMYLELYDNEWTDAYEELESKMSDPDTVQLLRDILMFTYKSCMKLSEPIQLYLGPECTKINSEFRQMILCHLKRYAMSVIPKIAQTMSTEVGEKYGLSKIGPSLSSYINTCIQICWMMAIQDPPMYLDNEKADKFDTTRFRVYTKSGSRVAYIVWPAILLSKDGALLGRGVAQGTKN